MRTDKEKQMAESIVMLSEGWHTLSARRKSVKHVPHIKTKEYFRYRNEKKFYNK